MKCTVTRQGLICENVLKGPTVVIITEGAGIAQR